MIRKLYTNVISIFIFFTFSALFLSVSKAASFNLSPESGNLTSGCNYETRILIDTAGQNSNSADITINYNISEIEIIDQDIDKNGTQIALGNAYDAYVYNDVNTSTGTIKVAGGSFMTPLNGNKTFAVIHFKSLTDASSTSFQIYFTGSGDTLDSNIAEQISSTDILTSVTNAIYTFTAGDCFIDTAPPTIQFEYPINHQQFIPSDAQIELRISDALSGVDVNSIEIYLDGILYESIDTALSYTGNKESYSIILTPTSPIPTDQAVQLRVIVSDYAGNERNKYITFNIPIVTPEPNEAPIITFHKPTNYGLAGKDTTMEINIEDLKDDINLETIKIFFNSTEYTLDSPEVTYEGSGKKITIFLSPIGGIPEEVKSYLSVYAEDILHYYNLQAIEFNDKVIFCDPDTGDIINLIEICESISTPTKSPIVSIFDIETGTADTTPPTIIEIIPAIPAVFNLASLFRLNLYAFAWLKRKKKKWGLVFDNIQNKPIPYTTVRVYKNNQFYKQVVTNIQGQYGFILSKGDYTLKFAHPHYQSVSRNIKITERESRFGINIGLNLIEISKGNMTWIKTLKIKYNENRTLINSIIFTIGFIYSAIASIVNPILFNLIIISLYILQLISIGIKSRQKKDWGFIYDSLNNNRITGALIKIFSLSENRQIEVMMSDIHGRYNFKVNPKDSYLISVSSKGYQFPSKQESQINIITTADGTKMVKISHTTKGNASQDIPMDMMSTNNLKSPFQA